jgi:hypothetical protein
MHSETHESPARDAVEPDMSWIDIAVCRNATVITSYSPGWAEFIDEFHFEDVFECDVPDLVNGLYRWADYKIGSWDEGDPINIRGGTFTPYALTTAPQGVSEVRGWLPIDSAPKDGARIDLGCHYTNGKWHRAPDCYWHKKAGRWVSPHHDKEGYSVLRLPFMPTHWMPLPSAPTPAVEEGERA